MKIRHDEKMIVNGRLTQVGFSFTISQGRRKVRHAVFQCECGQRLVMKIGNVKSNGSQSCGCLHREISRQLLTGNTNTRTHNLKKTGTYNSWQSMKSRCSNEKQASFPQYGGRGLVVCDRWRNSFENFLEDMGVRPEGCSIDRIDNEKGYSPDNCRWSSSKQQNRNRRNNVMLTIDGESKTVAEWCENPSAASDGNIYYRIERGWSAKEAVFGRLRYE